LKILPFKIVQTEKESFKVHLDEEPYLFHSLHYHPEIQLTLILKGEGTVICGDYVRGFKPGELYVVGANLPHVFKYDKRYFNKKSNMAARSISVYFKTSAFGETFFNMPELSAIAEFCKQAERGFIISGATKEQLIPMMNAIPFMKDFDRLLQLLVMLKILSQATGLKFMASIGELKNFSESDGKRLNEIFQFTLQSYQRQITLQEVAGIASMTTNAFCRYFKQHTRKSYITFLNELRIGNATKMLMNNDASISRICYDCGFSNLSNFNRKFKEITGISPSTYAKKHKVR
jgi:AraC-like DNA-binding protein